MRDENTTLSELRAEMTSLQQRLVELEAAAQEHEKIAADLREDQKRYRSVFAAMAEGVVVQDATGKMIQWNSSAEKILGLTPDQLQGRTSVDPRWAAIHEDGSPFPGYEHPAMVTLRSGEPCSEVVMGIRQPSGTLRWLSANSQPLRAENAAQPVGVVTSFSDITERKQAEADLIRYREIVKNIPVGLYVWHLESPDDPTTYRLVLANEALETSTGLPSQGMLGQTLGELLPDFVYSQFVTSLARVLRTGQAEDLEDLYYSEEHSPGGIYAVKAFPLPHQCVGITIENITDRRRAEISLQERERQYRALIESSNDLIWSCDSEARWTFVNPAAQRILGYSPEEMIGRPFTEFMTPEQARKDTAVFSGILATGEERFAYETEYICKDGRTVTLSFNSILFRDTRGTLLGTTGTATDITERKRAEEALRQSEERFALAVRGTDDGLWDWDIRTNESYYSPRFAEILGYAEDELSPDYQSFSSHLYEDDRKHVEAAIRDHLENRSPYAVEFRIRTKNGECRWVSAGAQAQWDKAGRPLRMAGSIRDITDRKQIEESLRASEERFRQSIINAPIPIMMHADDGEVLQISQKWTELTGYTLDEIPTVTDWTRKAYGEKSLTVNDRIKQLYETEDAADGEYLLTTKAGETRIWEFSSSLPGSLQDGRQLSISTAIDITQRKRDEEELRRYAQDVNEARQRIEEQAMTLATQTAELQSAKEAAEQASLAKSEFLANMSHEIRTPMNGVMGMTGLLLDTSLSPEQKDYAETVRRSADALLTIINDILDFSKIEAGKLTIEPIPFDLQAAVEETSELLAPKAVEQGIELILRYAPGVPHHLVGDPGRIRQIITNLVGNAIKFTHAGHVLMNVECVSQKENRALIQVSIQDTGIGIPEEKLDHLFDKFTQADTSTTRQYGGTGLGLAISKQLVELMGGKVWAESIHGAGSTFHFTLTLPVGSQELVRHSPGPDFNQIRVLIVHSHAVICTVLSEKLTSWGLRNDHSVSSSETLRLLREAHATQDPYHVVLLSYDLEDGDGEALGRMLKADPLLKDTVLIMLTAAGLRGDAQRLGAAGFSAYVTKPIRPSQLRDTLARVWSERQQGQNKFMTRHTLAKPPLRETPAQPISQHQTYAHVLLAEDNKVNQKVAVRLLEKLGCRVDVAGNGLQAVEMALRHSYDMIFMDCQMPEMDGYEATQVIRQKQTQHIPIIAMTANAMQGDKEKCLNIGMDDYVSKPVKPASVKAMLDRWCQVSQSQPPKEAPQAA